MVSDTTCSSNSDWYFNGKISEDMLCAGAEGKGSCQADSGGPFTVKNADNQHELVGVVNWGLGCVFVSLSQLIHHRSKLFVQDVPYGVYSEVAKLRTWINKKIAENGGATFVST